jgi:Ca-activated chloride channel family protein
MNSTAHALTVKLVMRIVYVPLFFVALLGPSFGGAVREIASEGKDITLLVDLSRSMDATDIQPSRLEKVKFEIQQLLEGMIGRNRVSIVVFSTNAYVHAPLTNDRAALKLFTQTLSTDLMQRSGSDLCTALDFCVSKMTSEEIRSSNAQFLVVFTDGEGESECSNRLIDRLRQRGIRLFMVGVGTVSGSQIPNAGRPLLDRNNQPVITTMNPMVLRFITQGVQGNYYELSEKNFDLLQLTDDLNKSQGVRVDQLQVTIENNKYYYFMALGLLVLFFDILITVRTFTV